MRQLTLCLLIVVLLAIGGCSEAKKTVKEEPITPTAREREMLRIYRLTADSQRGQEKLRKFRARREKLEAAQERVRGWAEEARKRREAEGEPEDQPSLNRVYTRENLGQR